MGSKLNRRDFFTKCSKAGLATCVLLSAPNISAMDNFPIKFNDDEIPDPKKLNFCGYKCPEDCKFLVASQKNDPELKKEAYNIWKIKERTGVEFEADKIFCFGCKNFEKPAGVVLTHCTVRDCVMEKEFDCCIECNELEKCDKELWSRFPQFKLQVINMQKKYRVSKKIEG